MTSKCFVNYGPELQLPRGSWVAASCSDCTVHGVLLFLQQLPRRLVNLQQGARQFTPRTQTEHTKHVLLQERHWNLHTLQTFGTLTSVSVQWVSPISSPCRQPAQPHCVPYGIQESPNFCNQFYWQDLKKKNQNKTKCTHKQENA